jgi:Protein of unknown function (DUF3040)
VALNENEERILHEIERRFYAHDPDSANRIGSTTLSRYLARNCKWAGLGFVVGLVVLLVGFASSWILGVVGFVVMLACAIVFLQNLRRIGRHGLQQLTQSTGGRSLNQVVEDAAERLRRRFGGDSSNP